MGLSYRARMRMVDAQIAARKANDELVLRESERKSVLDQVGCYSEGYEQGYDDGRDGYEANIMNRSQYYTAILTITEMDTEAVGLLVTSFSCSKFIQGNSL